ncbi:hypothetical protein TNCV_2347291 [Trichonephila clavipes]|nr:hypothetical protein TNCV_2347291 [Trichonephila clavipes]
MERVMMKKRQYLTGPPYGGQRPRPIQNATKSFKTKFLESLLTHLDSFLFIPAAKKKQHSPSHYVFGAPRSRFGAVKPFLPAFFPSRPRDVTPVSSSSAALFL